MRNSPENVPAEVAMDIRGQVDEVVSQTELHNRSGGIMRQYYRDGGLVMVKDRWGLPAALLVIGPAMTVAAEATTTADH
jgi:hypothetical protein